MKTLLTFLITISLYSFGTTQCNLSFTNISIDAIKEECDNHLLQGVISNTISLSASCGDLIFSPPLLHQTDYTATEETNVENTVQIAPNPFIQYIDIIIDSEPMLYTIQIFDILGKQVHETMKINSNEVYHINLEKLYSGAYIVTIRSTNNTFTTKKIIKI